jgi:hypothetical protein
MRTSRVSSDDFLCNKSNVLWLLGHKGFYKHCPAFAQLLSSVTELATFMQKKGLDGSALNTDCTKCDGLKALRAQASILDGFAQIFLWLYDHDRMQELQKLRGFVSAAKRKPFQRVVLAYAGKAAKKRERFVIVD